MALPMLDARRNEVYTSLFDRNMKQVVPVSSVILDEESLMDLIPETGKVVSCGDGAFKLKNMAARFPNLLLSLEIQSSASHLIMPAFEEIINRRIQ
jgi:tRNA threonylcarbamoyladenosine biosynthesis protein TsaB